MPPKKAPASSPPKKNEEKKAEERAGMEAFAKELEGDSDEESKSEGGGSQPPTPGPQPMQRMAEDAFETNGVPQLSEAERELIKEELKKTEDEILTLRQVLNARQKHASELKRKLGLSPLAELTQDVNKSLKAVTESDAYQKTSEATAAAAESVKAKFNDMRNSSLFKSFESKLGTAYTSTRMAASTSIDKLSAAARGTPSGATSPSSENPPQ